ALPIFIAPAARLRFPPSSAPTASASSGSSSAGRAARGGRAGASGASAGSWARLLLISTLRGAAEPLGTSNRVAWRSFDTAVRSGGSTHAKEPHGPVQGPNGSAAASRPGLCCRGTLDPRRPQQAASGRACRDALRGLNLTRPRGGPRNEGGAGVSGERRAQRVGRGGALLGARVVDPGLEPEHLAVRLETVVERERPASLGVRGERQRAVGAGHGHEHAGLEGARLGRGAEVEDRKSTRL